MSATAQSSKLAELRAKTDQQLVGIIDNALEVGLLLAANEPDLDPAGVLHRGAADIYADTVMLVEKVESVRDRRRLEEKLKQLRNALDAQAGGASAVKGLNEGSWISRGAVEWLTGARAVEKMRG